MRITVVTVRGHSMNPTLRDGQTVLCLKVPAAFIPPEAVILFDHDFADDTQALVKRVARVGRTEHGLRQFWVTGDAGPRSSSSIQLGWIASPRVHGIGFWPLRLLRRLGHRRPSRPVYRPVP